MRSVLIAVGRLTPEWVKKTIRGNYNSVVARFWDVPLDHFSLLLARLRGETYQDWYAKRLDIMGMASGGRLCESSEMETGAEDLETLKSLGLGPNHRLYEFGCGYGRSAQHFTAYLEPGNYYANDASHIRVEQLRNYFERKGLFDRNIHLWVNEDNSFDWVDGQTFDFIWSGAVLSHVPDDDVLAILTNAKKIMTKESVLLTCDTFMLDGADVFRYSAKDFLRRPEWYLEVGRKAGLETEEVSDHLQFGQGSHLAKRVLGASGISMQSSLIKYMLP